MTILRHPDQSFTVDAEAHVAVGALPAGNCENRSMIDAARHSRQLALPGFGEAAQTALTRARVLVIGAGGLGSVVLPHLVGAGVGTAPEGRIGIIDGDVVELSNLHRQHLHTTDDLGRAKVDSAADRLTAMDPAVTIVGHRERFTRKNALALLADYDVLIDGSDGFVTRYLAADAAVLRGIPLVWGAVLQFDGQVGVCPVGGPGYRDLFPAPPAADSVLDCATGGVLPTVCGVIGSLMAAQVIALLTGVGDTLVGRVTTYDGRTGRFRELPFGRDPQATPVTELINYEQFCGVAPLQNAEPAEPAEVAPAEGAPLEVRPRDAAPPEPEALELTAHELAALLNQTAAPDAAPLLLDVREPWEHAVGSLPNSRLLPLGHLADAIAGLPRDRRIVAYCHHGICSRVALQQLRAAGLDAQHLAGGIDAWSTQVDATVTRY